MHVYIYIYMCIGHMNGIYWGYCDNILYNSNDIYLCSFPLLLIYEIVS